MKTLNLIGTAKQVAYANDLYNELYDRFEQRVKKFEGRELKDFQIERQKDAKEWLWVLQNTTITNASHMIDAIRNYQGGIAGVDAFRELMIEK